MTVQAAINEWSCALACVTSLANDLGIQTTQDNIIGDFASHFPEWHFRKGLLTKMGILRLLELLRIPLGYVLLTKDRQELLTQFTSLQNSCLGFFIITHQPTNHCLRMLACNGDIVDVMEPSQTTPQKVRLHWSELDDRDCEYLLFCK